MALVTDLSICTYKGPIFEGSFAFMLGVLRLAVDMDPSYDIYQNV